MSRRRNWVARIRSNFDDPYFNDHFTKKEKNWPNILFHGTLQLCKISSKSESVTSGTLDDLTWNDPSFNLLGRLFRILMVYNLKLCNSLTDSPFEVRGLLGVLSSFSVLEN